MDWRIEREVTLDDFQAFVLYVRNNSIRKNGSGFNFFILFMVFLILQMAFLVVGAEFDMPTSFATMFGVMVWLVVLARHQNRMMAPAEDGLVLGKKEMRLMTDGIEERSDLHASFFKWTALRELGNTTHHLFLMIDQNAGLIIPKRAFTDEREVERFVSELQKRMIPRVELV
jgi:hypothetical protein